MKFNFNELISLERAIYSLFPCVGYYIGRRNRSVPRNIKMYFIIFFCMYIALSVPKVFAEECVEPGIIEEYFQNYRDSHFFESEEGFNLLPLEESPYNVDAFIRFAGPSIPSRDELIQKIVYHYTEYCDAKRKAEAAVKAVNIWNNAWEDLFVAASTAITTYGNQNYIQCFSIALITYASKNFIRFYQQGEELYFQLTRMDEHAESSDFYMRILKHYYGS